MTAAPELSIDDLKSDFERLVENLGQQIFVVPDDVKTYFQQQLFPVLSNFIEVIEGIDGDVSDMVEHSEDILQPETAGIFATVIKGAQLLGAELKTRLRPDNAGDKKWANRIKNILAVCETAKDTLLEITVTPEDEDEEPTETPAEVDEIPVGVAANDEQIEGGADVDR